MIGARRFVLGVLSVCALVFALAVSSGFATTAIHFGEQGSEAEQLSTPRGIAVDATGNVYVADEGNNRVDKFDGSGNWLFASGSGVIDGAGAMQTCTTTCMGGSQTSSQEAFELPSVLPSMTIR